jgi:hypothetical protein
MERIMKRKNSTHMHHEKLHALRGVLETSLQVLAFASLVRRIGPRRAVRVAAAATGALLAHRD